ncbi:subtilisin-like protease SBT4.3, partial [Tanacetum coccineum]
VYIVFVGSLPQHPYSLAFHHSEIIKAVVPPSFARESLLQSYRNFNGFSAELTEKESDKLRRLDGVESVLPNRKAYLQTTHSWDYMGFSEYIERNLLVESDTISGVIDSGIWPESESFNDDGLGPIPAKWKGVCQGGINFKCN